MIGVIALFTLIVMLLGKVSPGTTGSGPREVDPPLPSGLSHTPWELETIDLNVRTQSPGSRQQLVGMINRLLDEALPETPRLTTNATNTEISSVIHQLETHLELPPMYHY